MALGCPEGSWGQGEKRGRGLSICSCRPDKALPGPLDPPVPPSTQPPHLHISWLPGLSCWAEWLFMSPWGHTQYVGQTCSGLNACLPTWPSSLALTWAAGRGAQATWALDSPQAAIQEWEFLSWGWHQKGPGQLEALCPCHASEPLVPVTHLVTPTPHPLPPSSPSQLCFIVGPFTREPQCPGPHGRLALDHERAVVRRRGPGPRPPPQG